VGVTTIANGRLRLEPAVGDGLEWWWCKILKYIFIYILLNEAGQLLMFAPGLEW
ncbi:hypothetical protein L9F63_003144, partial [Diploptera punctata]